MATAGKIITNSKTGQSIRFVQTSLSTGGRLLEMESIYKPGSAEPPMHYHPAQEETFMVLSGEISVRINKSTTVYSAGESFHIPAGVSHSMWNHSDRNVLLNWKVQPALQLEYLFETISGLSNDNKTNNSGKPPLLQLALTASHFSKEFRTARPPYRVQQFLFCILKPFALLLGYRPVYKKYLD
ncbi:cupin domain-containing protein [Sediminibacterium ginsengisoli]|uniref:Cupin domain-containing protein n=1 Tax=Sediminibacterium ginsengisoli TaxID=413434 RepID=A0A1T4RBT1_9BACT|nr:cupin domain-containing protein [Sediminibacterium ginsengisoli]SKA13041.1 Cupin domain-containing protein [Sediminibacterium ginsengisoli]